MKTLAILLISSLLTISSYADPITEEMLNTLNELNNEDFNNLHDELHPKFLGFFESEEPVKKKPQHNEIPHYHDNANHQESIKETIKDLIYKPVEMIKEKLGEKHEAIKEMIAKPIDVVKDKLAHKHEKIDAVINTVKELVAQPAHEESLHSTKEPEPHVNHIIEPTEIPHHEDHSTDFEPELHEHHSEDHESNKYNSNNEDIAAIFEVEHQETPHKVEDAYTNEIHGEEYIAPVFEIYEAPLPDQKEPLVDKIKEPVNKIVTAASHALNELKHEIIPNKIKNIVDEVKHPLEEIKHEIPHKIKDIVHEVSQSHKPDEHTAHKIEHTDDKIEKPVENIIQKLETLANNIVHKKNQQHSEDTSKFTTFDLLPQLNNVVHNEKVKPIHEEVDEQSYPGVYPSDQMYSEYPSYVYSYPNLYPTYSYNYNTYGAEFYPYYYYPY